MDGILEWIDAGINAAVDVVAQTGQRVVNWVRGEGFVTDRQMADIKASKQYWELVETLKQKYPTMGEQYIREKLINFEINDSGQVTLSPRAFHAMGEPSNKGIAIAVEAALQEFDKQLVIDKLIEKLEKEGYFKDTSNVKGGVVVEYNRDGSIKKIVDNSVDGTQKTVYSFNGPFTAMERYNIIDGEAIKSYSEEEFEGIILKGNKTNGLKIITLYDSSGENVYRQSVYTLDEEIKLCRLDWVDEYLLNEKGEVIKDYKQYEGDVGNIVMNPEYAKGVKNESNYFKKSGCLLTSLSMVFDYYGDEDVNTPEKIDAYVDKNKLWIKGTAMVDPKNVVESAGNYKFKSNDIKDNFITKIQENIHANIPTIIHYSRGHFALVAGVRYDAKGNITDYLIRDPGTSQSSGAYLPVRTLYNSRWNSTIDKIYWILRNQ